MEMIGKPGTPSSLALRLLQATLAAVAFGYMTADSPFYRLTVFRWLFYGMLFQAIWSLCAAVYDLSALVNGSQPPTREAVSFLVIGDWTLGFQVQARLRKLLSKEGSSISTKAKATEVCG